MRPIIKLEQRHRQRLFLLPAFRQQIKILSLPILQLKEFLEEQLNSNPFLQRLERPYLPFKEKNSQTVLKPALIPEKKTLYKHLCQQAKEVFSEQDLPIAEFLIGSLNSRGFLEDGSREAAAAFGVSEKKIRSILQEIQLFDPAGIGARNLQESLLLQLKDKGKEKSAAYSIVKEYFSLLLKNQNQKLRAKLKLSLADFRTAMQEIKKLSFNPASAFSYQDSSPLVYDLRIEYKNGNFFIFLNKDFLPQAKISCKYLNLLAHTGSDNFAEKQKSQGCLSAEEKKYLKRHFFTAKDLLKNLKRRESLLQQLAVLLIQRQKGYLLGQKELAAFSVKELSQKLNISVSSAYRLIRYKYLLSPRGLKPLKNFFSEPVRGAETARRGASEVLQKLVREENKKRPLSDRDLSRRLSALGIFLKRRTVAKYRRQLKIAPAHLRKIG